MTSSNSSISKSSLSQESALPNQIGIPRSQAQTPNLVLRATDFYSEAKDESLAQKDDKINSEPVLETFKSPSMGLRGDSKEFSKFKFEAHLDKSERKSHKLKVIAKLKVGCESFKHDVMCILENKISTIFMTIMTIYALFGDDLRLLAAEKHHDNGFYAMACVCLVLFSLEISLASIAKKDYFIGFYFWLDIISTLSLIPDIGWIWDPIIGNQDVNAQNAGQVSSIVSASRGARVGTKAGRVVRIIRLIRLIRIVKLYKHAQNVIVEGSEKQKVLPLPVMPLPVTKKKSNSDCGALKLPKLGENQIMIRPSLRESVRRSITQRRRPSLRRPSFSPQNYRRAEVSPQSSKKEEQTKLPEESKVGKKLSDLTTRRVIILVLIMMFSVPLFTLSTYTNVDANTGFQFGLEMIAFYEGDIVEQEIARNSYINEYISINTPLIFLRTDRTDLDFDDGSTNPDNLRIVEKEFVTIANNDNFVSVFDLRATSRLNAGLGIARTVFICIVLAGGAIFFSKDANDLVIGPIEKMMQKVKKIAENPLEAAQEEENQALLEQIATAQQQQEIGKRRKKGKKKKKQSPMETQILEKTLIKIGALLALGFGEAGSKIIAENMEATGDVNPMIPGNKLIAIFGFCDIRQFTDTTEILQEDVMTFVNQIAEIVHSVVDSFSGAANKNIGDAFLLVWKFREEDIEEVEDESEDLRLIPCHQVSQIADMSVLSFLKIIASITKSKKLARYRDYPELKRRMPDYKVRMGFGLHVGWAIEGAIGSDFKIDASYLSPNVNMASRLEAATKQFGTPILISGQLYELFSGTTKRYMRQIDKVTVKGSVQPLSLYTCDMDISKLKVDQYQANFNSLQDKKRHKVRARMMRDRMRENAFARVAPMSSLFETDMDFKMTIGTYPLEFYQKFEKGFEFYLSGQWSDARIQLNAAQEIKGEIDMPTQNLLNIMKEDNFKAPHDWKGYRALTEK